MYLNEETARQLIDLNPNPDLDIIDIDIAERQFQVILRGFNHLIQPENNFLYIADEVGLGKTYIAIGIASLLRHFSSNPQTYNDVIIVPKQNLQYKWQKEINNFIQKNYLPTDNIVKSILNKPAANLSNESIKHQLTSFQNNIPNYVIYRNSSFSISSDTDEESKRWMDELRLKLPEHQKNIFDQVCAKFRRNQIIIKRAYAYLLNQSLPQIDLLIVDEAHNFKHGVDGDISIRNQVVSRTFGAFCEDEELFNEFPDLKTNFTPRIKKLLFLSATPINSQLFEIKKQLDCFLSNHQFKALGDEKQTESIINTNLNKFLIRGLMTIKVNQAPYSRNNYRHEHRQGNVLMTEDALPQYIKDNKTALVLSLMQYKTIKELKQKNNNLFEMGMLAGFETFETSASKYEDETVENRKENVAKDEQVMKNIVESYYNEFSDYPPHPKQDSLIEELFNLMLNRQKSLVFVRRIASVRELERKLFKKYSDHILNIIKHIKNYSNYPSLKKLVEKSELEKDRENIERIIDLLAERIESSLKKTYYQTFDNELAPDQQIESDLRDLFNAISENDEIEKFQEEVKKHVNRKNISNDLKDMSVSLIQKKWSKALLLDEDDDETSMDDDEITEEKSPYFFQRFFYDEGKNFKKKIYTRDWLELNLILVNDKFNLFSLDKELLSKAPDFKEEKVDFKKFSTLKDNTYHAIRSGIISEAIISEDYRTNTFLSQLLLDLASEPFSKWIDQHKNLINRVEKNVTRFIDELDTLNEILRSIFRQGSGLIPLFVADALSSAKEDPRKEFIHEMKNLLQGEFKFVLDEIIDIIKDYDKILEKNFYDKNKIRYNLIQQLPILGVSGHHKRDIRKTAIQFRMPGYPYVLISTDILKEGEDLHSYCKNIYHYGIAWNPSDMEQRTGRVDRIDSMAYRMIKQIDKNDFSGIPFQRKLQVFYPYLADTLEVNQMARLFKGMNKFIDIFYNDLSIKIEKESKANIDDLVEFIIPQRTGLLDSKYDLKNFESPQSSIDPLIQNITQSISLSEFQNKIDSIYEFVKERKHCLKSEVDHKLLRISGILNIRNDRQGPYIITIDQKKQLAQFEYRLESCLGRVNILGSNANRQKLNTIFEKISLKKNGLKIKQVERNSFIWLQIHSDINATPDKIYNYLIDLIHLTDKIEAAFSKKDEQIDIFN